MKPRAESIENQAFFEVFLNCTITYNFIIYEHNYKF